MSNVNIVVGLSGVGKSTVLEEAMKLSESEYEIINYGDRMLEVAMDEGLVDSRDEIKNISSGKQKEIQKKAADSILDDSEDRNVIVDTHAAIQTPHGYLPGLPQWTIQGLEPENIIVIDAPSEAIYERSTDDDGRSREHDSVEGVEEYRQVAREMAASGSVLTGSYLKIIENRDGRIKEASKEFVELLES